MEAFDATVSWGRIESQAKRILIVGGGPSLATVDALAVEKARESGVVIITVNAAALAIRGGTYWFSLDFDGRNRRIMNQLFWKTVPIAAVPEDFGPLAALPQHRCDPPTRVLYLHRLTGDGPLKSRFGLCGDAGAVHTGNSVYGALGVAWHMRPYRIGFLGLDGTSEPGFPGGHRPRTLDHLPSLFESAVRQLQSAAIDVRNGNPDSRITCFRRVPPAELLSWISAAGL